MSTPTAADRDRIAARYPVSPARHKVYLGLVTVLAVLLAGWLAWAGGQAATPDVVADVHSFHDGGEHQIVADLRVQREDPSRPAVCTLEATAENFVRVGELEATIPPGTQKITRIQIPVRTVNHAVSVTVQGCRAA
ncbi:MULTISPECIES: DUF4307 domain-containing protein [unclassified Luteococcus]|uniref:DUF4307 domain-containing protein n=1 Tax=unclassified Luteococcus TaxID=2639923 RepID=UPI00313DF208